MVKQVRITIPAWIVKLKGWEKEHLELVPINIKDDSKPISKSTTFIVKEIKSR